MFNVLKFTVVAALGLLGLAWKLVQAAASLAPDHSELTEEGGAVSRELTMAVPDELTWEGKTIID